MIKVLCVDDSQLDLDFIQGALADDMIDVRATQNPGEAVAIAKMYKPSMIILDLIFHGVSGFDLCRDLKTDPATAHIPIMLMSADRSGDAVLQGIHLGAMNYLPKPISRSQLRNAIFAQDAANSIRQIFEPLREKGREIIRNYGNDSEPAA